MEQKNRVLIKINGQEYPVVGAEPKEYLLKVGSFVDEKMEAVAKVNKKLSTSMIAVLTCINIADQYLKMKSQLEQFKEEIEKPQQQIGELEKYIETLHEELNQKDDAYNELEKELEKIKENQEENEEENEKVKLLKEELAQNEEDLEKAQILINDLQNKLFDNQIKLVQATSDLEQCIRKSNMDKKQ